MTPTQLSKLTPEQKRIRIAEACGWSWQPYGRRQVQVFAPEGSKPNWGGHDKATNSIIYPIRGDETEEEVAHGIIMRCGLDYLNDLNAMHEAEKVLSDSVDCSTGYSEDMEFSSVLAEIIWPNAMSGLVGKAGLFRVMHATAAQRADALLLAIG